MRIRRKKRLSERLQQVNNYFLRSDFDLPNVQEAIKDKKYINFSTLFNNDNPVSLEIGCGKGGFVLQTALNFPEKNYFAVELLENIVVMACESADKIGLKNVRFFNCGADYLPRYIKPNSIEKIYLNFSPPFPGKRYENRRLTKPQLIENYKEFLIDGGSIELRTDDKDFFEYSKENFIKNDFIVTDFSDNIINGNFDLFENQIFDKIKTEYEKKFIELGLDIFRLIAIKQN